MENLRNNLASVEFFMCESCVADRTPGDQVPDPGQRFHKGIVKILNSPTDKPALRLIPRARNVGIEASPATEIRKPASGTFAAHRDVRKIERIGCADVAEIILLHADHDRAGNDVTIGQDTVIGIARTAPETARATVEQILHRVKEGIPFRDCAGLLHTGDPVIDKTADPGIVASTGPVKKPAL